MGREHILSKPRVVLIFWGSVYPLNLQDAMPAAQACVKELVGGRYMNGLVEYGVGRGSLVDPPVIISDDSPPGSADTSQIIDQLIAWIKAGGLPTPSVNETNLVYMLFPPVTTLLPTTKHPNAAGYHSHGRFHASSSSDDLFFAVINTTKASGANPSSGKKLIESVSVRIAHELAEACTDRDGQGFHQPGGHGEICDKPCGHPHYLYGQEPWQVPVCWSYWHQACIHSDQPVSLATVLRVLAHGKKHRLRSLGVSDVGLESLASLARSSTSASG